MKTRKLVCVAAVVAAICGSFGSVNAIEVIAHRGNWKTPGATQNTIKSLQAADSINCYGSEFDVWLTTDKQLVVHHDADVYHTKQVIQDSKYKDISDVRLSNGDKIPTLQQYLEAASKLKTRLIFELKAHRDSANEIEAVHRSVEMVKRYNLMERTEFITFSKNAMLEFIRLTDRPVYYLNGEMTPAELKAVGAAGADYSYGALLKHPEWIKECQQLGMKVNIWTIDTPERIQWAIDHGVDFITTNEPSLVQQMLNDRK